jgi:hypothetical protein
MREGKIESYDLERRLVRKDGTIIWARKTASCVRKDDGSIDYFVSVIDVSISAGPIGPREACRFCRRAGLPVVPLGGTKPSAEKPSMLIFSVLLAATAPSRRERQAPFKPR